MLVLHKQQQAWQGAVFGGGQQVFQQHFCTQNGLQAFFLGGFVELDCAKQVVEVGKCQGGLPAGSGGFNGIVNANDAINDGVFRVQAKVNEHGAKRCCVAGAGALVLHR